MLTRHLASRQQLVHYRDIIAMFTASASLLIQLPTPQSLLSYSEPRLLDQATNVSLHSSILVSARESDSCCDQTADISQET
jgi:hypothetical protein